MPKKRGLVRGESGHRYALLFSGVLAFFAQAAVAKAQSKTGVPFLDELGTREQGQLEILQNRKYNLLNEFFVQAGGLPADPYNKGITAGAGYAIHMSQFVAWEVANFQYSFNIDSGLKQKLERVVSLYGLGTPQLPQINWFVSSHLVLKPIYGKQAIFNRNVIHMEGFVLAGPAIINRSVPGFEMDLGANVGIGVRFWMSERTSFRIDIQDLLFYGIRTKSFESALHLHAGLAFAFGGDE